MTSNQAKQFNQMLSALRRIAAYDTIEELQKNSGMNYGADYEEALEMAYENIKEEANFIKDIHFVKEDQNVNNKG